MEYIWYRIASTLSIPVGELKWRITHSEFLGWIEFFGKEENRHDKVSYYLAQLACEFKRSVVTNPKAVKVEDFLISFRQLPPTVREKMEASKAVWAAALNLDVKKN